MVSGQWPVETRLALARRTGYEVSTSYRSADHWSAKRKRRALLGATRHSLPPCSANRFYTYSDQREHLIWPCGPPSPQGEGFGNHRGRRHTKSEAWRKPCLKLSTKCRQLERQKWELSKKFPFLRISNARGNNQSPLALSPCESDLFCMGLSSVWARCKKAQENKSTSWVQKGLGWCFRLR